jgi:Mrp family chromosome partitioning ATPase
MEVLTAGNLGPEDLGGFSRSRIASLLEICRPNYDVILIDSPPVLGISDASVISQEVDVTLLLIQHRRYPRNVSQRAKRVIEDVGGKLFGVILNNVNIKTDDNYYYYAGYSTQYGYKKRSPRDESVRRATPYPIAAVPEDHAAGKVDEVSQENQLSPESHAKITFVRPVQGQDRF